MTTTTNDARKRRDARRKAFLAILAQLPGWHYIAPVVNFGAQKAAFVYRDAAVITMTESGEFEYKNGADIVTGLTVLQVVDMASNLATRRAVLTATPAMVDRYHALQSAGRFGNVGSLPIGI